FDLQSSAQNPSQTLAIGVVDPTRRRSPNGDGAGPIRRLSPSRSARTRYQNHERRSQVQYADHVCDSLTPADDREGNRLSHGDGHFVGATGRHSNAFIDRARWFNWSPRVPWPGPQFPFRGSNAGLPGGAAAACFDRYFQERFLSPADALSPDPRDCRTPP